MVFHTDLCALAQTYLRAIIYIRWFGDVWNFRKLASELEQRLDLFPSLADKAPRSLAEDCEVNFGIQVLTAAQVTYTHTQKKTGMNCKPMYTFRYHH